MRVFYISRLSVICQPFSEWQKTSSLSFPNFHMWRISLPRPNLRIIYSILVQCMETKTMPIGIYYCMFSFCLKRKYVKFLGGPLSRNDFLLNCRMLFRMAAMMVLLWSLHVIIARRKIIVCIVKSCFTLALSFYLRLHFKFGLECTLHGVVPFNTRLHSTAAP